MIVKICGVTRPQDAAMAARAGADWLGVNLWPRSRRHVSRERAAEVVRAAREVRREIVVVGVFVDQSAELVADAVEALELDFAQLHGDETPAFAARFGDRAIKALAGRDPAELDRMAEYRCPLILLDTPSPGRGGSGVVGDWEFARLAAATRPVVLAGGLTPDNVGAAIETVRPFGVDVASGVEEVLGVKDRQLVERFVAAARAAAAPPPRGAA